MKLNLVGLVLATAAAAVSTTWAVPTRVRTGASHTRQDNPLALATIEPDAAAAANGTLVKGWVHISQQVPGAGTCLPTNSPQFVKIQVHLEGLTPGKHGFHIHSQPIPADSRNCTLAAGHYNPLNATHGDILDTIRHVGDLGNIVANEQGIVDTIITDSVVSLTGNYSVIGKSFVVHALEDDLGKGGSPLSNTTGNAGGRLACGNITVKVPGSKQ
ncbi:chloroplastic copper zinc superoxide dismutase-2 [Phlyctochytrium arcticum]|nr:chloroplastic copper zinc superoxide dismutase-2 [Phlyctochytrium arcticum]